MPEYEMEKIKTGGFFSPALKVMYEIKFLHAVPNGEAKSICMFDDCGKSLGRLEYNRSGDNAKIACFAMDDWTSTKYAEQLLSRFIRHMKKDKVTIIDSELYQNDDKIHQKLTVFRGCGFHIETGGSLTGYTQYLMRLKL